MHSVRPADECLSAVAAMAMAQYRHSSWLSNIRLSLREDVAFPQLIHRIVILKPQQQRFIIKLLKTTSSVHQIHRNDIIRLEMRQQVCRLCSRYNLAIFISCRFYHPREFRDGSRMQAQLRFINNDGCILLKRYSSSPRSCISINSRSLFCILLLRNIQEGKQSDRFKTRLDHGGKNKRICKHCTMLYSTHIKIRILATGSFTSIFHV